MDVVAQIRDLCSDAGRYMEDDRKPEALQTLENAVALARSHLAVGHYALPMALAIFSRVHAEQNREQARIAADEAYGLAIALWEPDLEHQETILKHLVAAYSLLGDEPKAQALGARILSLLESFYGDGHPRVALARLEISRLSRN